MSSTSDSSSNNFLSSDYRTASTRKFRKFVPDFIAPVIGGK